ncbi:MAG: hypothetical protein H0X31_07155 [Nostocaceae cyanobacterium]|nr:hypothetical protein [Nostocaceae cyanobacterium]
MEGLLDVKYIARDYLADLVTRKEGASKNCLEIYQRYINGDVSLPNA